MKVLLLITCAIFFSQINAQSFNNNYSYDQQDLKFLFQQNKIEVFKFQFSGKSDSSLNTIIEAYQNKKLIKTKNLYKESIPVIRMGDDPSTDFFPKLSDTSTLSLRFYINQKSKDTLYVTAKSIAIEKRYHFNTPGINITEVRAFDNIPTKPISRQPLFVLYGNKNSMLLACPGDATVSDIVKMYDFVVVVYTEPFKLP